MQGARPYAPAMPGYTTSTSFGGVGSANYAQMNSAYQPSPVASGNTWGMGQDAFGSGNATTLANNNGLAAANSFGGGNYNGMMPRAQSSMLTTTSSFSAGIQNGSSFGYGGELPRSTSSAMQGPFTFTVDASGNPVLGSGAVPGKHPQAAEQMAGMHGPASAPVPVPANPPQSSPSHNLESQASWAMQAQAAEAPVPPAPRGRSGVLERQENSVCGVSQEPCGCSRQLDDCIARCRQEVQALAEKCRRQGSKYCDPDFPADARALFINGQSPAKPDRWKALPASWKRSSEGAFAKGEPQNSPSKWISRLASPRMESIQVYQPGAISGAYFLNALAGLRTIGMDPRELIVWREPVAGVYGVRLFKDGDWMYEILDDRLPMDQHGQPACSQALSDGEAEDWLALLEKAYAKVHGSYEAVIIGQGAEALEDVLGMGANQVDLREFPIWGELWQHLRSKRRRGYCMIASHQSGAVGQPLSSGLVSGHGYPVGRLEMVEGEMLVELENPWVHGTWLGRWGDNSNERKGANQQTAHILRAQHDKSRNFWMSIQDFCKQFNDVIEARGISPYWQMSSVTSSSARPSYPLISVASTTQAVFVLSQSDRRWKNQTQYKNRIGLRIYRSRTVAPPRHATGVKQNVSSPFKNLELLGKKDLSNAHSIVIEVAKMEPNTLYIAAIDSEHRSDNLLLRVYTACPPKLRELSQPETQYLFQAQATAPIAADHDSFSSQGSQADPQGMMSPPHPHHGYIYETPQYYGHDDYERNWGQEADTETVHLPKMIQACINTCSLNFRW